MPVIGDQIDANERQVGGIVGEHAAGNLARLRGRFGVTGLGRQRLRRLQAPLAEHPLPWFRSP